MELENRKIYSEVIDLLKNAREKIIKTIDKRLTLLSKKGKTLSLYGIVTFKPFR